MVNSVPMQHYKLDSSLTVLPGDQLYAVVDGVKVAKLKDGEIVEMINSVPMSRKAEIEIFSVDEKLPEPGTVFVAAYWEPDGEWISAAYNNKRETWQDEDATPLQSGAITHWFEWPADA